jgi:predicted RNA-binding protein with PIN domain
VTVLVDGNNVIGTRPDGWWRDRAGAARSLLARLQCFARDDGAVSVEVVFDVVPPDLGAGVHEGVLVHAPARRGRDAADDRIVELLEQRDASAVEVITSDRNLAARAQAQGARVTGARTFLDRLDAHRC